MRNEWVLCAVVIVIGCLSWLVIDFLTTKKNKPDESAVPTHYQDVNTDQQSLLSEETVSKNLRRAQEPHPDDILAPDRVSLMDENPLLCNNDATDSLRHTMSYKSELSQLMVDYIGVKQPLFQIATISIDNEGVSIEPWSSELISAIETAIQESDINADIEVKDDVIRISGIQEGVDRYDVLIEDNELQDYEPIVKIKVTVPKTLYTEDVFWLMKDAREQSNNQFLFEHSDAEISSKKRLIPGIQFDQGVVNSVSEIDSLRGRCELLNPQIVLVKGKIYDQSDLVGILDERVQDDEPVLLIAEDFDEEAVLEFILDRNFDLCAVKTPGYGDRRTAILEDIAAVTGGEVFSIDKSYLLDRRDGLGDDEPVLSIVQDSDFERDIIWNGHPGRAYRVIADQDKTTILDGSGDKSAIKHRAERITDEIKSSRSDYDREKLQERKAKLENDVVVVNIGKKSMVRTGEGANQEFIEKDDESVAKNDVPSLETSSYSLAKLGAEINGITENADAQIIEARIPLISLYENDAFAEPLYRNPQISVDMQFDCFQPVVRSEEREGYRRPTLEEKTEIDSTLKIIDDGFGAMYSQYSSSSPLLADLEPKSELEETINEIHFMRDALLRGDDPSMEEFYRDQLSSYAKSWKLWVPKAVREEAKNALDEIRIRKK